jgi:hypothetical protein
MLKIGIVILLLLIELVLYYSFGVLSSFFVQVLIILFFFYWYYSERKATFNNTDKLLIGSTVISLFSPLADFIPNFFVSSAIKFTVIIISYALIIWMFRAEGAKLRFNEKSGTFLIFVSYIFMPCAFLFAVIFPLTHARNAILASLYIVPLICMVLLSTFLPFPEKSKFYISLSMFLVLLASGVNAYRIYISSFLLDYALLRVCVTLCRFFMLLGMLYRFEIQTSTPK